MEPITEGGYYLKLRDDVDVSEITKDDLTGWIENYTYDGGYSTSPAKIKVTIKDVTAKKYSIAAVTMTADETQKELELLL